MKPIRLTTENRNALFKNFFEKFKKELDDFSFNLNDTSITVSTKIGEPAKEKITVLYSQQAYIRMMALVDHYNTEVGWYGLVNKVDDKTYFVYDVKVCKQYVTGGKVDTEDADMVEFFDSLTDEEANAMHFQAHSHVKMDTTASGTDLQNQADIVKSMGNSGFYIFQIWNKSNDINTYIYDIDNNVFYDRKDVILDIVDEAGTVSDFIASTKTLVTEKKYYPYYTKSDVKVFGTGKKKDYEPFYLPGYYNNYGGDW